MESWKTWSPWYEEKTENYETQSRGMKQDPKSTTTCLDRGAEQDSWTMSRK